MRRRHLLGLAAALPVAAYAQAPFPTRAMRVIIPFAPGGRCLF